MIADAPLGAKVFSSEAKSRGVMCNVPRAMTALVSGLVISEYSVDVARHVASGLPAIFEDTTL